MRGTAIVAGLELLDGDDRTPTLCEVVRCGAPHAANPKDDNVVGGVGPGAWGLGIVAHGTEKFAYSAPRPKPQDQMKAGSPVVRPHSL